MLCHAVSPLVTDDPQGINVTITEGSIVLTCTATGFPSPTIVWFHNDTLVDNSSYTDEAINFYTTRSIFNKSIPVLNDSGSYFCRAVIEGYDAMDSEVAIVLVQGKYYL